MDKARIIRGWRKTCSFHRTLVVGRGISWALILLSSCAFWISCCPSSCSIVVASSLPGSNNNNKNALLDSGPFAFQTGKRLFQNQDYEAAAPALWRAVLLHEQTPENEKYEVHEAFQMFLQCYVMQNRVIEGFLFVAEESFQRGQTAMGQKFLEQAMAVDPNNAEARRLKELFLPRDAGSDEPETTRASFSEEYMKKSPEELYQIASGHFSSKEYEDCADVFELSCYKSGETLGPSCANAVYCRTMILDWGFNGTYFDSDMARIEAITHKEAQKYRFGAAINKFVWQRSTSVHPHMMLGYPVDPTLKRYTAESVAYMDERMARVSLSEVDDTGTTTLPELPEDMPFSVDDYRERFAAAKEDIIRVGFVGSGFNSKAVLYLSQDMYRFFNYSRFEIHVFSFGPPDNPMFIQYGMRGVDWRERVRTHVNQFHDCQRFSKDHVAGARYIHDQNIHILIEWDGYARQGERAQGLFALRPAPIQMLHQEYLGSSGALYVDYLFSDLITSPPETQNLYTEKIIYLPNHFFSKGHAYQAEVKEPTLEYLPRSKPYKLGTGTPRENRCMAYGKKKPSFVFCNFNKFLKNNPQTVRSWIRILREVPDSMLCLLENPKEGVPYLRKFVHEAAGSTDNSTGEFVPGDGDSLNDRIHFLPWERNPFDHQMRNQDFCNVMLDSFPYNGHTVAQDALYGGVPIVTRSDGQDMCSRVTTSANIVLGLDQLNAYSGPEEYEEIAIRLGTNTTLFKQVRAHLINTCLQRNPMHPYWDVARYVKNFETGLEMAWNLFVEGKPPQHIIVAESEQAKRGTYDDEILAHPQDGERNAESKDEL